MAWTNGRTGRMAVTLFFLLIEVLMLIRGQIEEIGTRHRVKVQKKV